MDATTSHDRRHNLALDPDVDDVHDYIDSGLDHLHLDDEQGDRLDALTRDQIQDALDARHRNLVDAVEIALQDHFDDVILTLVGTTDQ